MRETGLPFDDFRELAAGLPAGDEDAVLHTRAQLETTGVSKKDKMGQICEWYSRWSGRSPAVHRGVVTLFAGTHTLDNSLSEEKAGADILEEVTHMSSGGSVVNRLCHQHDLGLKVFDLALQLPINDISQEPALDEKSCAGTIAFGMEAIAGGSDLLCIAAVESKTSTSALSILSVMHDLDCNVLADNFDYPAEVILQSVENTASHRTNPLEVLRRLGGRETAAICGAILAARSQHIPVLLDGLTALAAASILKDLNEASVDHCMFAQRHYAIPDHVFETLAIQTMFETIMSENATNGLGVAAGVIKSACLLIQGRN